MRPMQVWVPVLGNSVGLPWVRRDMQRAYEAWRNEEVLFLVPGLANVRRWLMTLEKREGNSAVAAVPSEHREAVSVWHLGANGYLWNSLHTPASRIDGLLETWLNFDVQNGRLISPRPPTIWLPSVKNGALVEQNKAIRFESMEMAAPPAVPISILDEEHREIGIRWPPDERWPATIHPDAEAVDYQPQHQRGTHERAKDSEPCSLYYWWPPPFGFLFGVAAGLDAFKALVDMRRNPLRPPATVMVPLPAPACARTTICQKVTRPCGPPSSGRPPSGVAPAMASRLPFGKRTGSLRKTLQRPGSHRRRASLCQSSALGEESDSSGRC
jgi:hypothetical protein